MLLTQQPKPPKDLSDALIECKTFAKRGHVLTIDAVSLLKRVVRTVLCPIIFDLERDNTLRMIPYYKAKGITKRKMEQTIREDGIELYRISNLDNLRIWANKLPKR